MEPYEIIMAPYTVYVAPVDETFPDLDETPGGNWVELGTSGDRSYEDEGVTVTHSQTLTEKRTAGSTGVVKAVRTEEDVKIHLVLCDVSIETYAAALNSISVTTVAAAAGTTGYKSVSLYQGADVNTVSLLVRGVSPYGADYNAQYEIPVCYQSANPAPAYGKGNSANIEIEYTVMEDPNAASADDRFGSLKAQNADALDEE